MPATLPPLQRPLTVLVLGASGYLGRVAVEHLTARGHRVLAGRRPAVDLAVPESLAAAVTDEVDAVVNLATPTGSLDVDSAATAALLSRLRGTGRALIYTSGVWVLGRSGRRVLDETTRTDPIDLVRYRPLVERQVLDAAADGVRAVVLRPGVVYGRAGGIPGMLVACAAEHGVGLHVGASPVRWPMVHVDDLAELYVRALEQAPAGAVLHGVAGPAVDTRDLAAGAAAAAGVAGVRAWPLTEAQQALGADFADALALDQVVSAELTSALLGWSPQSTGPVADLATGSYLVAAADAA